MRMALGSGASGGNQRYIEMNDTMILILVNPSQMAKTRLWVLRSREVKIQKMLEKELKEDKCGEWDEWCTGLLFF